MSEVFFDIGFRFMLDFQYITQYIIYNAKDIAMFLTNLSLVKPENDLIRLEYETQCPPLP